MKLSPLHFHLSIFIIEKRLPDSASWRLSDSESRGDAERKKIASKSSFRTRRSSFPLRNPRKKVRIWQFWAIPAAFNHSFIPKIIALLLNRWFFAQKRLLHLFSLRWIYQNFIYKKGASNKSSEDINIGESVLMNVTFTFKNVDFSKNLSLKVHKREKFFGSDFEFFTIL